MDPQKTGALITTLRKQQGLTQKQLAEQLHVSVAAVCKWEKGVNTPDISNLKALSDLLNISISEIVNGEKAAPSLDSLPPDPSPSSEEITPLITKLPFWKFIFTAVLFVGLITIGALGIRYYNNRPPEFTIVDSYYGVPEQIDMESYGFDKAYWVIVEYTGKIDETFIQENEINITSMLSSNVNLDNVDMIYIEYHENYEKNSFPTHVTTIFLPLLEEINL